MDCKITTKTEKPGAFACPTRPFVWAWCLFRPYWILLIPHWQEKK